MANMAALLAMHKQKALATWCGAWLEITSFNLCIESFSFDYDNSKLVSAPGYLCSKTKYAFQVQYCSFITSLLHTCTRMAPRSIWRVKILGLPWKFFFHETSRGISRGISRHESWHSTTRVISTRRGFPRNESWHLHATCMTVVIHTVIRQTNPREILLFS